MSDYIIVHDVKGQIDDFYWIVVKKEDEKPGLESQIENSLHQNSTARHKDLMEIIADYSMSCLLKINLNNYQFTIR